MTAFSHPPHPANARLTTAKGNVENLNQPPTGVPERDAHILPSFDLHKHVEPILYLPPLLSSLPKHLPTPQISTGKKVPLVTETRLPDIDSASLSLHKALHHFQPVTSEYAEVPYNKAFNWPDLELPEDEEREWYCVAFKSQRKAGSDGEPLYEADRLAHEEAILNGGLIMYWYGIPNPRTGLNLATCIWQSRNHASAANSRPYHIKARRLADRSYEVYTLYRYKLVKTKGTKHITVEEYTGGDVGW